MKLISSTIAVIMALAFSPVVQGYQSGKYCKAAPADCNYGKARWMGRRSSVLKTRVGFPAEAASPTAAAPKIRISLKFIVSKAVLKLDLLLIHNRVEGIWPRRARNGKSSRREAQGGLWPIGGSEAPPQLGCSGGRHTVDGKANHDQFWVVTNKMVALQGAPWKALPTVFASHS
ncbi:hypothetical protein E6O75_ATG00442 [Venturia nashicola]|uniref:Uncharacterized protein n=1 Tax=Venturia nashicola TaxID=86259 RepID=A0A4Z1PDU1_9PEZI|nr:hypothetical protein E6O75_ATG00442 [Venturia nashicola]